MNEIEKEEKKETSKSLPHILITNILFNYEMKNREFSDINLFILHN